MSDGSDDYEHIQPIMIPLQGHWSTLWVREWVFGMQSIFVPGHVGLLAIFFPISHLVAVALKLHKFVRGYKVKCLSADPRILICRRQHGLLSIVATGGFQQGFLFHSRAKASLLSLIFLFPKLPKTNLYLSGPVLPGFTSKIYKNN